MTITEFLEARIAEDEELARKAIATVKPDEWEVSPAHGNYYPDDVAFWERATPARVLAECAAKRWVIDTLLGYEPNNEWVTEEDMGKRGNNAAGAIRKLASVYSDHPGYRQEWAL